MRKLLAVALLIGTGAIQLCAQNTYQGLLWKITGNGLQKPSYLFGTMHVSQKLAFHLGEPWFNAINEVDVVAGEISPDSLMSGMVASDFFSQAMQMAGAGRYGNEYMMKERLAVGKNRLAMFTSALNSEPDVINNVLYRYSESGGDNEEDSWLDMYIHQVGRKMGKVSGGLETFDESMESFEKSTRPEEEEPTAKKYDKDEDYSENSVESAYRSGNLDLLDSLFAKTSTKNTRKFLINERNARFVHRMDSIMKNQALFAGVGAAHLAGEKGMINLLRQLGYTVTAVKMGERDAKRKAKLDETLFEVPFTRQYSNDSSFSYELPCRMYALLNTGNMTMDVATEVVNGTFYSVNRVKTYSSLLDGSVDRTWQIMDSMLYDYAPGKITEQKKVTINGYQGVKLITKSRKGHSIGILIVQLPGELVVFKASAPDEKIKTFLGERFFSSIQFSRPEKGEWQPVTMPNSNFSIVMPERPVYYGKKGSSVLYNDMVATDTKAKTDYMVLVVPMALANAMEEDTFDLSQLAESFTKANDYTEKARTFVTFKNRPALKVSYGVPNSRAAEVLFVVQNQDAYVLGTFGAEGKTDGSRFFESAEFRLPAYEHFYPTVDSVVHISCKVPYQPKKNYMETLAGMLYNYGSGQETENKDYALRTTQTFTDKGTGESIEVTRFKYSKYFKGKGLESFKKMARYYASGYNDYIIKNETLTTLPAGLQMDFYITDTNTVKTQRWRILLVNGTKYTITASIDPVLGESKFVTTFFDSFQPIDSLTGRPVFADKASLFFEDIYSADTLRRKYAETNIGNVKFTGADRDNLLKLYGNIPSYVEQPKDFKVALIASLKEVQDSAIVKRLAADYDRAGDTSDYQFAILKFMAGIKTTEGMRLFKELLLKETPLATSSYTYSVLFEEVKDSLKMAAPLFPALLQLTAMEEYKDEVYSLLASLVDSGLVKPEVYKNVQGQILIEAKNKLKRVLSQVEEKGNGYGEGDLAGTLTTYTFLLAPFYDDPAVKAHFDKIFASNNMGLKLNTAWYFIKRGKPVNQAIIEEIAADDAYRKNLYNWLAEIDRLDRFPAAQKTQEKMARALAVGYYYYYGYGSVEKDSFSLLGTRKVKLKDKKGTAFFFKYPSKSYGASIEYKIALIGIMPEDTGKITMSYDLYMYNDNELDEKENIDKQLDTLLAVALKAQRKKDYFNVAMVDTDDEEYIYNNDLDSD